MNRFTVLALALVIVVVSSVDAFALGRRNMGMVCNVSTIQAAAPAQATPANLAQVAATAIVRPLVASRGPSVLDVAPLTKVDLRALQALNAKPGAGVPSGMSGIAAK